MNRRHATVISLFLAFALVLGTFAAVRTTSLGVRAQTASSAQIAAKNRQLDRYQAALRRAAHKRPPALPALPAASRPSSQMAAAAAPRVVYQRPAPIVHVIHRHGGEDGGGEHEGGSGGGGFDD